MNSILNIIQHRVFFTEHFIKIKQGNTIKLTDIYFFYFSNLLNCTKVLLIKQCEFYVIDCNNINNFSHNLIFRV